MNQSTNASTNIGKPAIGGESNILIGENEGANITTASNCICIGKNSGLDITDQDNQVRIGDNAHPEADDMVIFQGGRVVISKKAFESLIGKESAESIYKKFGNKP